MIIAPVLHDNYLMNAEQREIVAHKEGPLLITAGPGSGKTRSLILLALNLLLCRDTQPSGLVLCTYTEKAAYEMQDRLMQIARDVEYQGDLSQLRIGTIHSICKHILIENIHHTPLENDFETLDQFTQQLLMFEHLDEICPTRQIKQFFQEYRGWGSRWNAAKELTKYFDTITEELLFDALKQKYFRPLFGKSDKEKFQCYLTHAYSRYQKILARRNCLDFAHLQKCAYNLLKDPVTFTRVTKDIRYVLVDEYQDTNYIQEQILTLLASATAKNNLCVVGDEDQALYRFRGATVRNLLEFPQKFPDCKKIYLTTNYRSHKNIIGFCNRWIEAIDWSNPHHSLPFRTEKNVRPRSGSYPDYQAVATLTSGDIHHEAEQFAELIVSLKKRGVIQDYSQVALLLRSVKEAWSAPYRAALEKKQIPVFCPRARAYFDHQEVQQLIGCFMHILDLFGKPGEHINGIVEGNHLPYYLNECSNELNRIFLLSTALKAELFNIQREIKETEGQQEPVGKSFLDYFYRLLFLPPFLNALDDEKKRPQLVLFSQLLSTFQRYYRYKGITQKNVREIGHDFFNTFLALLYREGVNQYEHAPGHFPEGHVPLLTIHQSKGLEFPVVVVGNLQKLGASESTQPNELEEFYHRPPFEPYKRIPAFDRQRLYYVAFSRARDVLILAASRSPHQALSNLWQDLPVYHQKEIRAGVILSRNEERFTPKERYGLTSHIQLYQTCPRRFEYLRSYNFEPTRRGEHVIGELVHSTLERIHRIAIEGKLHTLDEEAIRRIFERKFQSLIKTSSVVLDEYQKEQACKQIQAYVQSNQGELQRLEATELDIRVEREEYILTGKIDVLVKTDNGLDLIDFKTTFRPANPSSLLTRYQQQLYFYAYALEQQTGQLPRRLLLYWTAESQKENALMQIPYTSKDLKETANNVDAIASRIKEQQFRLLRYPEPGVCKSCDIRHLCWRQTQ